MNLNDPIVLTLIYLSAMVILVPIAKKAGLGAVLGYLLAGALLGPHALGLLGGTQGKVLHFAEFGVIMMLFLIGLELNPSVLWKLRLPILGLGGLQVTLTIALITFIGHALGGTWQESAAAGMILALSSTAIVLQTLQERGAMRTTGGSTAFSVLLFQDIAVIPMLALFPLLAMHSDAIQTGSLPFSDLNHTSLDAAKDAVNAALGGEGGGGHSWLLDIKILIAVSSVVFTGKYLVRPLFKLIDAAKLRELFTAMALLLVVSTTLLMNAVGLSPALGAFLAGVVLAESEYRHQLETDIAPFKGLLLGVFFMSVGAGIDFTLLRDYPGFIGASVLGILVVKWVVLFLVGKVGRLPLPDNLLLAFCLAQGGEFAFVLLKIAVSEEVLDAQRAGQLTAAVALSMFCAPLLIQSYYKWIAPRLASVSHDKRDPDSIPENSNPVIVAGFGRFGQMVTRLLKTCGINPTVLDFDAEQVDVVRKYGMKAFYGDASRMDLLRSAGAANAKLLIVAIDDLERALEIIDSVKKEFPHLKILARAYDRIQAYEMIHRGVENPYIETAGSALNLGTDALRVLGFPAKEALKATQVFKKYNDESIQALAKLYHEADEASYLSSAREWIGALENTLKGDIHEVKDEVDRAWESEPRPDLAEE